MVYIDAYLLQVAVGVCWKWALRGTVFPTSPGWISQEYAQPRGHALADLDASLYIGPKRWHFDLPDLNPNGGSYELLSILAV